MKRKQLLILLTLPLFLTACSTVSYMPAPDAVVSAVPEIAKLYLDMPYEWGGQSWWWEPDGSVDCSGLVINVYKEAGANLRYELPYDDSTVREIYQSYSIPTEHPRIGDVIFMGDDVMPSHIAILIAQHGDAVEFIDAYSEHNKVEQRIYKKDNPKILGYGIMLMKGK